ncbi:hypothetical protein L211DRAFT_252786 [Terfezia boudieri ATCC MYA-4762]|uniref:DDE-1 domain-containing protein n=1 Tax=Terfezia boudieri ATCC MYA-4762 TaxID=1051890 RepID=A0A3N4M1S5_9PEZI|nr:hypothetical protein L211DRAFT_252786 [Terfezia boudieri ATCC MYA-4762]
MNIWENLKKQGRRIMLITDNCPSYPLPTELPQNYPVDTSPPPVLQYVTLYNLPKNTTPFL